MKSFTPHPSVWLLLLAALFPVSSGAETYSGIVAFGDSLTDTGNKYAITGLSNTPPYDLLDPTLVPDGPYTKGGLHHSNGKTWVEQYAKPLGLGAWCGRHCVTLVKRPTMPMEAHVHVMPRQPALTCIFPNKLTPTWLIQVA